MKRAKIRFFLQLIKGTSVCAYNTHKVTVWLVGTVNVGRVLAFASGRVFCCIQRDAHVANCHPASEARHLKCGTRLWLVNTAMFTSWIQLCLSSGFGRAGNKLLA